MQREHVEPGLFEGLSAYAKKQADVLRCLRRHFAALWRPRLLSFGLSADWFTDADLQLGANSDVPAISEVD